MAAAFRTVACESRREGRAEQSRAKPSKKERKKGTGAGDNKTPSALISRPLIKPYDEILARTGKPGMVHPSSFGMTRIWPSPTGLAWPCPFVMVHDAIQNKQNEAGWSVIPFTFGAKRPLWKWGRNDEVASSDGSDGESSPFTNHPPRGSSTVHRDLPVHDLPLDLGPFSGIP